MGNGGGRIYFLLRNYWNSPVSKTKGRRGTVLFLSQINCQKVRSFQNKLHLFSHSSFTAPSPTFLYVKGKMTPTRTDRGLPSDAASHRQKWQGCPIKVCPHQEAGDQEHADMESQDQYSIPHERGWRGTCPHTPALTLGLRCPLSIIVCPHCLWQSGVDLQVQNVSLCFIFQLHYSQVQTHPCT